MDRGAHDHLRQPDEAAKKPGNGEAGEAKTYAMITAASVVLIRQYSARFRYTSALGRGQLAAPASLRVWTQVLGAGLW